MPVFEVGRLKVNTVTTSDTNKFFVHFFFVLLVIVSCCNLDGQPHEEQCKSHWQLHGIRPFFQLPTKSHLEHIFTMVKCDGPTCFF